jgi:ferric-dicitrate binding protein FerR (iron transport regulator)
MDETLIKKFLDDQCSPEELEEIMRLSNSAKGDAYIFSLLQKKWKENNIQKEPDFLYKNLLRKINNRISEKESAKSSKAVPGIQPTRKWYLEYFHYAKVAATIAIFVIVSTVLTFNFNNYQQNSPLSAITYVIQSTSVGQKLKFRLPDGTDIILNAASSIKYPDHFPEGKREVFLSGEAFFDVKRDTSSPFIVHNDKITTTALGTSFNIKATNNEVNVALATGRVSVEMEGIREVYVDFSKTDLFLLPI